MIVTLKPSMMYVVEGTDSLPKEQLEQEVCHFLFSTLKAPVHYHVKYIEPFLFKYTPEGRLIIHGFSVLYDWIVDDRR